MPEPWKIKISEDDAKLPVFQDPEKDGDLKKLVFINPEGTEVALDAPSMYEKIIEMGKSEKGLRGDVKRLEAIHELFVDIDDIPVWHADAVAAIEKVANFDDKDWMDIKKVEKLKSEMNDAHKTNVAQIQTSFATKDTEYKELIGKKDAHIRTLMVSNKFATHPLFAGKERKTTLLPEIAETFFGQQFKVEEGDDGALELRAYHKDGDPVYSHEKPGELADFTEAMYSIFDKYPGKDELLKGGDGGSGAGGGQGGDENDDTDKLTQLKTQYAEAMAAKNTKLMVTIKNEIFRIENAAKKAA